MNYMIICNFLEFRVRGIKLKVNLLDALWLLLEKFKYGIPAIDNVFGMFRVHKASFPLVG